MITASREDYSRKFREFFVRDWEPGCNGRSFAVEAGEQDLHGTLNLCTELKRFAAHTHSITTTTADDRKTAAASRLRRRLRGCRLQAKVRYDIPNKGR